MVSGKKRAGNRLSVISAALFGTMALLLQVEARLALPPLLARRMQLATLVLTYGLLALCINAVPGATIH